MCVCVFTTHNPTKLSLANHKALLQLQILQLRIPEGLAWKDMKDHSHLLLWGNYRGVSSRTSALGKGDGVSCFAWSCLLGFLHGNYLEFSQELWRRWADTQNFVFRAIRISSSYTGDEKLCFTLSQTCWLIPLFRDMDWLKCQLRIQGVFWSGLFWKILFLPILGLWRDSKIPLFFLNAAEF